MIPDIPHELSNRQKEELRNLLPELSDREAENLFLSIELSMYDMWLPAKGRGVVAKEMWELLNDIGKSAKRLKSLLKRLEAKDSTLMDNVDFEVADRVRKSDAPYPTARVSSIAALDGIMFKAAEEKEEAKPYTRSPWAKAFTCFYVNWPYELTHEDISSRSGDFVRYMTIILGEDSGKIHKAAHRSKFLKARILDSKS